MADPRLTFPVRLSIAAALLTLILKGTASWLTGSIGLLSDAAESLVNLVAASLAYLSLHISARPADTTHTYGHEKIEFFSSGVEGGLIVVAAVGIAGFAVNRLFSPEELQQLDLGAGITLVATVINCIVARILLRAARAHGSIVLEADGKHLMTDVLTSTGVLVALVAIRLSNRLWQVELYWLDPVIALALAANIAWTGVGLVRRSFDGLMDHALPDEEQARVRAAIESQLSPDLDYHAVRTRRAGSRCFIDFHLLVPGETSVRDAHALINRIESSIQEVAPDSEVTIHAEPIEERASWEDSALLPLEQAARMKENPPKRAE